MQNLLDFFRSLPNSTKIFFIFVAIGLLMAGVFNASELLSRLNQSKVDELIEVQLLVETEESQPVPNVEVRFTTQGAPDVKYTNSSGYTQIKIPSRSDVDVVLTKEGYEPKAETINLKIDPDRNKKFRLKRKSSSVDQSFIYQHYTINNDFIPQTLSLLDSGFEIPIIKKLLSEQLQIKTTPLVFKKYVFETIQKFKLETGNEKKLHRLKYNIPYSKIHYTSNTSGAVKRTAIYNDGNEIIKEEYQSDGKFDSFNSEGERTSRDFAQSFIFAPLLNPFLTNDENSKYTAFLENNILQFPKLGDMIKHGIKDSSYDDGSPKEDFWIQKVLKNNPDQRGFLGFTYTYFTDLISKETLNSAIASCDENNLVTRITPSPYIKFVDIKNIAKTPIKIEGIGYKLIENNPYKLTPINKRNSLFSSQSENYQELNLSLEPEKHFLIPIEFGFNTDAYKNKDNNNYITEQNNNKEQLKDKDSLYVPKVEADKKRLQKYNSNQELTNALANKLSLNKNFILNSSSIDELLNLIPKRFAVGSILNVNSIRVNSLDMPVSSPNDEPLIYISKILQVGSCPFLMVYNSEKKYWLEMGTVLTNINQKKLQQEKIYKLGNNISQIKIEERESEITYIDSLSILYTSPGSPEIHQAATSVPELKTTDKSYFTLHKGESFNINLKNLIPTNAANIKLKINGYYETI